MSEFITEFKGSDRERERLNTVDTQAAAIARLESALGNAAAEIARLKTENTTLSKPWIEPQWTGRVIAVVEAAIEWEANGCHQAPRGALAKAVRALDAKAAETEEVHP